MMPINKPTDVFLGSGRSVGSCRGTSGGSQAAQKDERSRLMSIACVVFHDEKQESSEMSYERWTAAETFLDVPHDRFPVHAARRLHPADTDACSETSSYSEDEGDKAGYGIACDLWSLGVICYLLLCGYPPFNGRTATQTLRMIRRGTYTFPPREWKSVSDNAKDLIKVSWNAVFVFLMYIS